MKKKASTPRKGKRVLWSVCTGIFTVLFAVTMIGGPIANNYASIINLVLGVESDKVVGEEGETHFEADFTSSKEQQESAEAICESVEANGAVLMLNRENALPLAQGAKVTLVSQNSVNFVYGGSGSGGMDTSAAMTLKEALEEDGFSVNPTMWDFYSTGAGKDYGRKQDSGSLNNYIFNYANFAINEVPMSAYSDTEWNSIADYGDAAIMVISRVCGEGTDIP